MANFFQKLMNRNDPVFRAVEVAIGLIEEERYDQAIELLRERALEHNPSSTRARLHIGIAHMLKGDLDEAERYIAPLANGGGRMNSEKAAAQIALERVAKLREERTQP